MSNIVPIVMSGGSGTRMWPKSRQEYPKQFLPLFNETSMLQDTLLRLGGLETAAPIVVCNEAHRFLVAEQLQQSKLAVNRIVLEPMGRNTAPAIAIAALLADPDDVLLVLAADHVITNVGEFHNVVRSGSNSAEEGNLVTFGIVPSAPETGYGYIQSTDPSQPASIKRFVEKPDLETAKSYVDSGDYFWNSGMFMFKAGAFLEELKKFQPEVYNQCQLSLEESVTDLDFLRLNSEQFEKCPNISVDYAVMEHTEKGVVLPSDIGWSDVGSWSSLWEVSQKDGEGNRFIGDVVGVNSRNNLVHSDGRLVALVGIEDVVVVDTDDAVLIAKRDQVQDVKSVVSHLRSADRCEHLNHRKVRRPWGSYDSIDQDAGFQVKRITVNPGASLSLQMHHHRAEHWIVVEGTAEVTCDDNVFIVEKNESTYIPLGSTHRLTNPGKIPLKLIEVQSGDYLGEDDIVRFEDNYGRTEN
jgi:mannose-1-phosphate guanylyltransferase/mannose-6-phosphate isomerase